MSTKSAALSLSEVLGLGRLAALEGIRDRAPLRRGFATGVSDYVVGSTDNRISGSKSILLHQPISPAFWRPRPSPRCPSAE